MTSSGSASRSGLAVTEMPFGLPGRVLRSPMPFSDFDPTGDSWRAYREFEVDTVVILAEREEALLRTGMDLFEFYRGQGLQVVHVPIRDHASPADAAALSAAVERALAAAGAGSNLAVHCYAGIGRTGVFLALLARRALGLAGEEAISWVRRWIPGALETPGQQQFVIHWEAPSP
ncbi:MAG: protein-tyrosine phosphatase family protein [Anaerolineales bacterium]